MNLSGLTMVVSKAKYLLNENSTTILTGVGVAGVGVTAYLTGRATFKAADLIEDEKSQMAAEDNLRRNIQPGNEYKASEAMDMRLTKAQTVLLVWKQYVPPVISGVTTIAAIIGANRISSRRVAALTVAAGLSERALQEYREKIADRLTGNEYRKLRDEIAQDRVNQNPVESQEVIIVGTGEALFYDNATGRYFQSTMEEVKKAANKVNYNIVHYMYSSLSDFYDEIGLPATAYTDTVGFNTDHLLELDFSATISTDGRPCIVIDFENPPISGFNRFDYS